MTENQQATNTKLLSTWLIGAVLAGAAITALSMNRDEPRPTATPDAIASPVQGIEVPAGIANGELPPGHPPLDAAPRMVDETEPLPPGHPPIDQVDANLAPNHAKVASAVQKLADGVDVHAIYTTAAALEGQRVRVRARIVKSTPNILGRTWLHVQDGSGDAAAGTHDLVVTTQGEHAVGQTVVIEGVVVRNKDLGSGYRYDVLLEEARVELESDGNAG